MPREDNKDIIYMFGSGAWEGNRKVVKIGYTSDITRRTEQYLHYNPLGKIISTRSGDRILELKLHLRLTDWKVEFLNEWFYDEPEVMNVFENQNIEELDKWLWDNRGLVLLDPTLPLPGTLKRTLLDDLSKKY